MDYRRMSTPTEQIKSLARFIEYPQLDIVDRDFLIAAMSERSPIFEREVHRARRERAEKEARRLQDLLVVRRNCEAARPILSDLPASTSSHDMLAFEERIIALSTADLVRRRNAQNLFRHTDIPQRERLEAACRIVSAEMVRRRRADVAGVTALERAVAVA
jgi:hypothetical protein